MRKLSIPGGIPYLVVLAICIVASLASHVNCRSLRYDEDAQVRSLSAKLLMSGSPNLDAHVHSRANTNSGGTAAQQAAAIAYLASQEQAVGLCNGCTATKLHSGMLYNFLSASGAWIIDGDGYVTISSIGSHESPLKIRLLWQGSNKWCLQDHATELFLDCDQSRSYLLHSTNSSSADCTRFFIWEENDSSFTIQPDASSKLGSTIPPFWRLAEQRKSGAGTQIRCNSVISPDTKSIEKMVIQWVKPADKSELINSIRSARADIAELKHLKSAHATPDVLNSIYESFKRDSARAAAESRDTKLGEQATALSSIATFLAADTKLDAASLEQADASMELEEGKISHDPALSSLARLAQLCHQSHHNSAKQLHLGARISQIEAIILLAELGSFVVA